MLTAITLAAVLSPAQPGNVVAKLIPKGATAKTGGYSPIRAAMTNEAGKLVVPSGLSAPKFGQIAAGSKSFAFVLDEPEGKPARLIIDSNGDGDLTNDADAKWEARKQGTSTMYFGDGTIELTAGDPAAINMYRFDPTDPKRAALKDTLMYYYDFGFELTYKLDGKSMTSFIAGFPSDKSSLTMDRNADGKISYKRESFAVGKPFNFTGTTYVLNYKDGELSLDKADKKLPMAPLPPDFRIGKKAIEIKSATLDGGTVSFPKDYKGKIVMLDFWATWCGPCIAELPNVKAAYAKWHTEGFEILGISFDNENMTEKLKEFADKNGMPWKHIYEGKGWNTVVGDMYDVSGIPFVLLVDGDTGEILGDAANLRGPGIVDFVGKALAKKKGK